MSADHKNSGKWVFWTLAGFFGIIFLANAIFLKLAFDSHSGSVEESAYEKGLTYDDRLEAAAIESRLGWSIRFEATRDDNGSTGISLTIRDRDGAPLDGLEVSGRLVRAVVSGYDVPLSFEGLGDGRYRANADVPLPGRWQMRILAIDEQRTFRLTEQLNL